MLGMGALLLSGCLDATSAEDPNTEGNSSESDDDGNDTPYDIPRTFVLSGEFTEKSAVTTGFEVLSSGDERFDGLTLYSELFARIEDVDDEDRNDGLTASTRSIAPDSDEGVEVRETISDIRTEMDAETHENDRWESRWGTHYVKHDGSTLMVYMDDGGVPE